jgi:hypothetical protein
MDYTALNLETKAPPKHEVRKGAQDNVTDTSIVCLDPLKAPGVMHTADITQESTKMANELLQQNHLSHHIFATREDERGVGFQQKFYIQDLTFVKGVYSQPHHASPYHSLGDGSYCRISEVTSRAKLGVSARCSYCTKTTYERPSR